MSVATLVSQCLDGSAPGGDSSTTCQGCLVSASLQQRTLTGEATCVPLGCHPTPSWEGLHLMSPIVCQLELKARAVLGPRIFWMFGG